MSALPDTEVAQLQQSGPERESPTEQGAGVVSGGANERAAEAEVSAKESVDQVPEAPTLLQQTGNKVAEAVESAKNTISVWCVDTTGS